LTTGPVSKQEFASYKPKSSDLNEDVKWGHTEVLEETFGCLSCMTFLNPRYRIGLVTQHVPLRKVSEVLTADRLYTKTACFIQFLVRYLGYKAIRVGIMGLNPHAASDRYSDSEERNVIEPAIQKLQHAFPQMYLVGPLSPDTAFQRYRQLELDGMVSLYHDQALTYLKGALLAQTVNVTAGLPFVRTSVDHGPARDLLPGQGDDTNMLRALEWAIYLKDKWMS
jgi:4-hydroxythreonine-4-phosphate dehydrogenase